MRDRYLVLQRELFYWRGVQLHAASGRTIWLGEHQGAFYACGVYRRQRDGSLDTCPLGERGPADRSTLGEQEDHVEKLVSERPIMALASALALGIAIVGMAAHLPHLVCVNGHVVAEGSPREVIVPHVLEETFGAQLEVLEHLGMPIVVDSAHPTREVI